MNNWFRGGLISLFILFLSWGAAAQSADGSPLTAMLSVELVHLDEENDTESFTVADQASPGDTLQYTGVYTNVSETPLEGLIIRGPIPTNTVFDDAGMSISADAAFEVLIENEEWQELPAYKTVKKMDGTEERVLALPVDFKEVRWKPEAALEPEKTIIAVYRVKIAE